MATSSPTRSSSPSKRSSPRTTHARCRSRPPPAAPGGMVDGDQLMAVIAQSWKNDARLAKPGVVATIMSNLGLERFLGSIGLSLARTAVGDRYVLEHMREHGFNLGGEQSGHIILSDFTTTGDGLLAA